MEAGDFALEAGEHLQLVDGHDDGSGFEGGSAVKDADHRIGRALNLDLVTDRFVHATGQNVAEQDLWLAVLKLLAGEKGEGVEFIGVGAPAKDQRIDLGREVDHVEDHGAGLGDDRHGAQFGFNGGVDGGVEEGLVDDGDVGSAAGVEAHPLVLKRAGEADQGDERANGHADADQRQRSAEAPAPQVLPCETREG